MRTGNVIVRDGLSGKLVFTGAYAEAKAKWASQKISAGETCELSASDMRTKVRKGEAKPTVKKQEK